MKLTTTTYPTYTQSSHPIKFLILLSLVSYTTLFDEY